MNDCGRDFSRVSPEALAAFECGRDFSRVSSRLDPRLQPRLYFHEQNG